MQYIGDDAFYACRSLEKMYILESVELIDGNIFSDCSALTEIAVSKANKEHCSADGVPYTRDMSFIASYPMGEKQQALRNMGYDGDFECLDFDGLLTDTWTEAEKMFFY